MTPWPDAPPLRFASQRAAQSALCWSYGFAAILLGLCTALASKADAQTTLHGRVVQVSDGDTLTVLDAERRTHRVRLYAIDAPERGQDFGERARLALAELCADRHAEVRVIERDRYDRIVGQVNCQGSDANAAMVSGGLAWVYTRFAPPNSPLFALERAARESQIGLWGDSSPQAPWDWRAQARRSASQPGVHAQSPAVSDRSGAQPVRGNLRSQVYHRPDCPNFDDIHPGNRVLFDSSAAAEAAGYRLAGNCP